jgi:ATP synthase, F1 delta subunit
MDVGRLSMRYAKALFSFASEKGATERVYAECKCISNAFSQVSQLRAALASPLVSPEQKVALVSTAADPEASLSSEMEDFIRLVMHNGRENYLGSIALMYLSLFRRSRHVCVAKLTTAVPLEQKELDNIRKASMAILHASKMEFDTCVDPSIEGGFIFDFNDYRFDASVAAQLKRVKEQLIDRNRRIV